MQPVFAYLDPATVTLIISAVVGGFAAVAMFVKRFWYRFKNLFVKSKPTDVPVAEVSVGDAALEDE